ncbi:hypothetical protein J4476_04580 [Candidatus Woesearchaeota archaeon]|nr:hypothetical protein [Candidatus Woesearchaeota archaeon]HIH25799.1 hypothetical protein [Nanoarchaeota archaeon]
MVRQLLVKNFLYSQCEKCKSFYKEESNAKSCQDFCSKYSESSPQLIKNSVKLL